VSTVTAYVQNVVLLNGHRSRPIISDVFLINTATGLHAHLHQCIICYHSIRPNFKLVQMSTGTKFVSNKCQVQFFSKTVKFPQKLTNIVKTETFENMTRIEIHILQGMQLLKTYYVG